jgi:hypothetical protein
MSAVNITEQITLLVELQKLDSHILSLEKKMRDGPIRIQGLEDEFKRRSEILKVGENQLKAVLVKQKEKENELLSKEELIKKCQTQLYLIKTNKEYTVMQQEIKGHEADKSKIEDELLALMDEAETGKGRIEKDKAVVKIDEEKMNQEKAKVNAEIKAAQGELAELKKTRDEQAAKVDKQVLKKYERILKGKDGLVLVVVTNGACGGCHMNLPPQVFVEIKMKEGLVFCESCSRILYLDE